MNFEGFKSLIQRVAIEWWALARKEIIEIDNVKKYLKNSPFSAQETPENASAYERLMDSRCKLFEISAEIDANHDAYMDFMNQCLENSDLLEKATSGISVEEKHLIYLELMIMEQVEDWEVGVGKTEQESAWTKSHRMVLSLPDGKTKTVAISQAVSKRYWFGICPVSSKIGNLKMCGGCQWVGYVGKEEQKEHWPCHKQLCKILKSFTGRGLTAEQMQDELRSKLKKKNLDQYEIDLTNFPRRCVMCGCDDHNKLKNCKNCFCIAFCPNCVEGAKKHCEENSSQRCAQLRIAAEDYRNEQTLGHQVQSYKPKSKNKFEKLPENIELFFSKDVSEMVSNKLPGYQDSELRYLTFLYTCPLTTLFGAECAGTFGPKNIALEDMTEMTIHLVGTRLAEMRNLTGWEIIAHRLPQLKKLTIVFIGDECPLDEFPKDFTYKSKELQTERADLTIRYMMFPMFYQEYANAKAFLKPDLVVALDCGFKFYPTWVSAIPCMLKFKNVPLVFTEFTLQDQKDNLDLVVRQGGGLSTSDDEDGEIEVVVSPRRNPYTSRRPVRCSDKTGNYKGHSVIYTNDYLCVVKRKHL